MRITITADDLTRQGGSTNERVWYVIERELEAAYDLSNAHGPYNEGDANADDGARVTYKLDGLLYRGESLGFDHDGSIVIELTSEPMDPA